MTSATRAEATVFNPILSTVFNPVRSSVGTLVNLPLKSTTEGTFTGVSSFTRATTATVKDFEGLIKTVLSGEVRFEGARRVENALTDSEDLDNAAWADLIQGTGSAPVRVSGNTYIYECGGTAGTDLSGFSQALTSSIGTGDDIVATFIASSPDITTLTVFVGGDQVNVTINNTPTRYSVTKTGVSSNFFQIRNRGDVVGAAAFTLTVTEVQIEKVSGQTNQNPSEYVSVGVATGVEEIDNSDFATGIDNWSAGDAGTGLSYISATPAMRITNNDSTASFANSDSINTAIGKTYVFEVEVDATGSNSSNVQIQAGAGGYSETLAIGADNKVRDSFVSFGPGAFVVKNGSGTINDFIDVLHVTVKEADHGANIDAVRYATTENGNTVSNNIVTLATGSAIADATLVGYLREPAATNLILNSDVMVTQNITTTAAERTLSFTGTGTVTLTGTSTAGPLVGTGANDRVSLTYTPSAGTLTLTVSGTVNMAQDELGGRALSWIPTAASPVTRNADVLSYQAAGNFEDAAGTVSADARAIDWTTETGQIFGDGTEAPLLADTTNSGIQSFDGTNTANGPSGTPSGTVNVAARWSGTSLEAISGGVAGTAASYDGAFTLAQLNIGAGTWAGNIGNVLILNKST